MQKTLPSGTSEQIRAEAKILIQKWDTPRDGFIAADYGDNNAIGVKPENVKIIFQAFMEYGKY